MNIDIRRQNVELHPSGRRFLTRRLQSALSRFGERIGRVQAYLNDVNGPRGGVDKRFRVVVQLRPVGLVVIKDEDENWGPLFDRVLDRLEHNLQREIERRRDFRKLNRVESVREIPRSFGVGNASLGKEATDGLSRL